MTQQPYDLPLTELKSYQPALTRQPDFDEFWKKALAQLSEVPLRYELIPHDYPVNGVKVYRIQFTGFQHANIDGWLVLPDKAGPHPGLVMYHGYNWALEGNLHDTVNMGLHGYAALHMLVRGQQGNSVDNVISSNGTTTGWMTKGIQNPEEYFFRAVYMDAVRAVEILASLEEVDASRLGVTGGSQGGALALAAGALSPIPAVVCADYPYLSHFERSIDIAPRGPYHELNEYFRRYSDPRIEEQAKRTLTYHDIMNLAPRVQCHTWISVGLIDEITPPSTIFAVFNHLGCTKEISIHRYFGHEFTPGAHQQKLRTLFTYLQK